MSERPRYPRSTCACPGCARWSTLFPGEWLCAFHWRMVPARCRRALKKVWQEFGAMPTNVSAIPDIPGRRRWIRYYKLDERLWAHAKRAVVLRAAGL